MKLITYTKNSSVSCAILVDDYIIDIPSIWPGPNPPRDIIQLLQKGQDGLEKLKELSHKSNISTPLDSVKLLAPILLPPKILALAGNYSQHIAEAGLSLGLSQSPRKTTVPKLFLKPSTVVTDPNAEIPWPTYSEQVDYEIELAVVIGKTSKNLQPENALDYVAGFTIVNDISARSVTFAEGRTKRPWDEFYDWLNGKWSDRFLPMGPYLLTCDEIQDVQNLNMTLTVNGRLRQKANTSQMIFPVKDIVSFASHIMTLQPGDIIATGTPAGVAMATGDFLKSGDIIQCSIEKLGTLTNSLGQKPDEFYKPLK